MECGGSSKESIHKSSKGRKMGGEIVYQSIVNHIERSWISLTKDCDTKILSSLTNETSN